jgi:nitroreductase
VSVPTAGDGENRTGATFETVLEAVASRRSWSSVTDDAPTHEELARMVAAAGRVADHSSLRPWRLIEMRGDARRRLGKAIAKASKDRKPSDKPLRAPLLIAVVVTEQKSHKVPRWEQEAVASGVAHTLSLLLDAAGWGVFWRTGWYTRSKPMRKAHGLAKNEELLGWLYVGGIPERKRPGSRRPVDPERFITRL